MKPTVECERLFLPSSEIWDVALLAFLWKPVYSPVGIDFRIKSRPEPCVSVESCWWDVFSPTPAGTVIILPA